MEAPPISNHLSRQGVVVWRLNLSYSVKIEIIYQLNTSIDENVEILLTMATEWGVGPWCSLVRLVFDTNIAPAYNKLFKLTA